MDMAAVWILWLVKDMFSLFVLTGYGSGDWEVRGSRWGGTVEKGLGVIWEVG
jgi:hypothetical protein